jgi:outer membrane protein
MRRIIALFIACVVAQSAIAQDKTSTLSLSLKGALERSQEIAVNVLVANARVQQSLGQLNQNQAALLPQISATLNGQRQSRDLRMSGISIPNMPPYTGSFNTFDARARITQTIFDAGTFERLKAARLSQKFSQSQLEKAKEDTMALVAVMYIQAKRAAQEVEVIKVFVKRDAMAYKIAKTEYEQGTKTLLELKKAKADFYESKYLFQDALTQAKEHRLNLAAALQLDPTLDIDFDSNEDEALLNKTYTNSPPNAWDVRVAEDQVAVDTAQVTQTKADNYPKVSLLGDYGRSGESPSESSNTYTIGLMATVPIWQGGSQQAKTAEAKAKLDESKAVLEDVKFQSSVSVMEAEDNIAKAKSLIKAKQAQLSVVRQQLKLATEQYDNGLAQEIDVMRAKARQVYDRDQFREAVAVLWIAHINLAKAQGQMQQMLR